MAWYKISMTNNQVAQAQHMKLQEELNKIFMQLLFPKKLAFFGSNEIVSKIHEFYISIPDENISLFKLLLAKYSAQQCAQPKKGEVALLLGHQDAFDLLAK